MFEILDFCHKINSNKFFQKLPFINAVLLVCCFCLNIKFYIFISAIFGLIWMPIAILGLIRSHKWGDRPIFKMSEEEIILNELTGENNWEEICSNYILTEDFMRKYKNNVHWDQISERQNLNEKFIKEMWENLKNYPMTLALFQEKNISPKFYKGLIINATQQCNNLFEIN